MGDAADVIVGGGVITIEVGDMDAAPTSLGDIDTNDNFEINLKQSAGITNPAIAGVYHVEVDDDGNVGTNFSVDDDAKTYHVRIDRRIGLKPNKGVSGDNTAFSGDGYDRGVSAHFHRKAQR